MISVMPRQRWSNAGIQLPPGWHNAVTRRAERLNLTARSLYVAAVDAMLRLPDSDLKPAARRLRDLGDDDFEALAALHSADQQPAEAAPPPPASPAERERFGEFIDEVLPEKARRPARKRRGA